MPTAALKSLPSFFPVRLNSYVPAMKYAAEVNMQGTTRCDFGTPIAAAAAVVVNALSIAAASTLTSADATLLLTTIDGTWGRNLTCVASGAATSTITVNGFDYLGQPMTEVMTLNGTTPVVGLKCFKYIRSIAFGVTAAVTASVGVGAVLGLPYKALRCSSEELDGAVGTIGTLTTPSLATGTSTTSDPRGKYAYNATLTGSARLTATFLFDNTVDSSTGLGGLYGLPHYSA